MLELVNRASAAAVGRPALLTGMPGSVGLYAQPDLGSVIGLGSAEVPSLYRTLNSRVTSAVHIYVTY